MSFDYPFLFYCCLRMSLSSSNSFPVGRFHAATCVRLSGAQNWRRVPLRAEARSCGTSLCGDDSNVVPLLLLSIQFHGRGDEAIVRGDAEQSLGVRLRINRVPEKKWTGIKGGGQDRLQDIKRSRRINNAVKQAKPWAGVKTAHGFPVADRNVMQYEFFFTLIMKIRMSCVEKSLLKHGENKF